MQIYFANLNFKATEQEVRDLFSQHGNVTDVKIINDRETGKSRGFGFVTIDDDTDAQRAIEKIDGYKFMGRELVCNKAKPAPAQRDRS